MLVVINSGFGGYALSVQAQEALIALGWTEEEATFASYSYSPATRSNPDVVQVVKQLGKLANGKHAELQVRNLVNADKKKWQIKDDNGWESIVPYALEPDEGPAFGRLSNADKCYDN